MTDIVSYKEGNELIDALVTRGLTPAHIKIALDSEGILDGFVRDCTPPYEFPAENPRFTTLAHARAVFGKNYHDPAKWASECKFRRSAELKETFAWLPEDVVVGQNAARLLIPILPLSLAQLYRKYPQYFYNNVEEWFAEEWPSEQPQPGWMLLSNDVLSGTTFKTYSQHEAMLWPGECLPTAPELAQALICHAVLTGELLLPCFHAISSTVVNGNHVSIGRFSGDDRFLFEFHDGHADNSIGALSCRKLSN